MEESRIKASNLTPINMVLSLHFVYTEIDRAERERVHIVREIVY